MYRYAISTRAKAKKENVIEFDGGRITVLTDSLFRVERGTLTDLPTQIVWFRDFASPVFEHETTNGIITVRTERAVFEYHIKSGRVAVNPKGFGRVTRFSAGVLPGTRRTLDMTNGRVRLQKSVLSRRGAAVMNDDTLVMNGEDFVSRGARFSDKYYFAYGARYRECIADLFRLTGAAPLLPKFVFGNWWSRYHAYTADEYVALMERFAARNVPFTVATIDMDWHWVDVEKRFGKQLTLPSDDSPEAHMLGLRSSPGWTGYSVNTELFPDFGAFLNKLKELGLIVTMNLHPAQGIRPFEDCYDAFARYMGRDPAERKTIGFSLKNKKFIDAYFDIALAPYERAGVRFWWIDWQQGKKCDVPGLDPLWALNHLHIADMAAKGMRPLILSRYAGPGSHRYPLGFSGDSAMTFRTLTFQPYMTACASNVAYSWWSHDIGGHHFGYKDDELYLRWIQFGVFSPIMRLHSTSDPFMGKEPWKSSAAVSLAAERYLRLRHRLIPYLYSMNFRTHRRLRALTEPMYYAYDAPEAYRARNQYYFGDKLVVCPVTRRASRKTGLAYTDLWVPEGRYTDVFTGRIYKKGKYRIYRDREDIPVFALPGAIIPMYRDARDNYIGNDKPLDIVFYRGKGEFELYFDDGDGTEFERGGYLVVHISIDETEDGIKLNFSAEGDISQLGNGVEMALRFGDVSGGTLMSRGETADGEFIYRGEDIEFTLINYVPRTNAPRREMLIDTVSKFQMRNLYRRIRFGTVPTGKLPPLLRREFKGPLEEIFAITEDESYD